MMCLAGSYIAAYYVRLDPGSAELAALSPLMWKTTPLLVAIGLLFLTVFEVYRGMWRYASINDLYQIIKAVTATSLAFVISLYVFRSEDVPRGVVIIQWLISLVAIGGLRFGARLFRKMFNIPDRRVHVLIVGAGDSGDMIVRQLMNNPQYGYNPVGFIDDDQRKRNLRLHGLKVLGDRTKIPDIVDQKGVQEVIIATPSATGKEMRDLVDVCKRSNVKKIKTVPGIRELMKGEVSITQLREVRLEDLLGREPIHIDAAEVGRMLTGQRVLVTGAGGSIGSELCRQILPYRPAQLICLDRSENSLYFLEQELRRSDIAKESPESVIPVICDIGNSQKLQSVFDTFSPNAIFHAAAHKHVPLMESFPDEAVLNNVIGTLNVMDLGHTSGSDLMVLISTDKAVAPSSIMGASKRVAEQLLQAFAPKTSMRCITVRFGNVLGSNGSVVPLFQKQISQGGPVTITHPDMKRYFMTIPEAVQLITQAAAMGGDGDVYILDMGEPVRIMDMAEQLITLSGFEPGRDIQIEVVGLRPGEKLEEILWNKHESPMPTRHRQILMAKTRVREWDELLKVVRAMERSALEQDHAEVVRLFQEVIPDYEPGRDGAHRPLRGDAQPALRVVTSRQAGAE